MHVKEKFVWLLLLKISADFWSILPPTAEMFVCLFLAFLDSQHSTFVELSGCRFLCVWQRNEQRAKLWFMVVHICLHATLSFLPSFLPPPVDIREIRELRLGKGSRDFERYPEEARKLDASHCFIVLYGLEFRLRMLSLAGQCVYKLHVCVFQWFPMYFHSHCLEIFFTVLSTTVMYVKGHTTVLFNLINILSSHRINLSLVILCLSLSQSTFPLSKEILCDWSIFKIVFLFLGKLKINFILI